MAIRQNVGIGGLYPTGRAPLAVDLATPTAAITQRMIKREEQRIAGEKEQISANQQAILKALDFETVQGLSDKIQTEHLENLNKVWNNWAEKFASKQGKLSFADLKELQDDKRKIESNLGKMQADVKTFAFAQNELSKPNARQLWDEQSWLNLKDYANQGKVGSGDAINILVPRQPSFIEHIQSRYKSQMSALEKRISNRMLGVNTEEGRIMATKDNLEAANSMWESLKQQPDVKQYIGQIGETQAKEQFLNAYGFSVKDDYFSQGVWKEGRKGTEPTNDYYYRKYGWDIDKEQTENLVFFNDVAEGIRRADKDIIESLTGVIDRGLGNLDAVEYKKIGDEEFILLMPSDEKKKPQRIKLPPKDASPTTVRNFKKMILDRFQSINGKQIDKNIMKYIEPDWDDFTGSEPVMPMALKIATEGLLALPNAYEEGEFADTAIKYITDALPDVEVEKAKGRLGISKSNYKINVTDPSVEGEQKTKEYDLRKVEDRQALSDWIIQKSNYKEAMQDRWNPNAGEEQRKENVESMEKLVEAARQDAVSLAKKNNLKSLQEFKDFKLSIGLREEDIDRAIEQLGLTDEDFQ